MGDHSTINGVVNQLTDVKTVDAGHAPHHRGCIVIPTPSVSLDVTLEVDIMSPLDGSRIRRMPVPWRWMRSVSPGTPAICDGQTITVGTVVLSYGNFGLQKAD